MEEGMFDGGRAGVAAPEVRTDGRCELSREEEREALDGGSVEDG